MYLVEDKGGAIALILVSILFLGTWPMLVTMLERRGRPPQHTYLDYSITNFLAAAVIALTLGEAKGSMPGSSATFLSQLITLENWPSKMFAMAGGVFLSLGTVATQYGWALVGLSVTEVISSSLKVVIGTTMNYFLDDRINRAEVLFPGVACFLVAAVLGAVLCTSNAADNEQKKSSAAARNYAAEDGKKDVMQKSLLEDSKAGTAEFLIHLENQRSIKGSNAGLGIGTVIFAGLCFSLFSPAFNLATNDQLHFLRPGVPHLTIYTAFFYFSVSTLAVAVGVNAWFLRHPMAGAPQSSFRAYAVDSHGRSWALLAGALCGLGNVFQFMAGQAAGYAAADAVQALPLVSTMWGVVLFGEYRRSSRRTYALLAGELSMFVVAMLLLMASAAERK